MKFTGFLMMVVTGVVVVGRGGQARVDDIVLKVNVVHAGAALVFIFISIDDSHFSGLFLISKEFSVPLECLT